jgi:nucleoside-diphosphate-sugar epimerase
LRRIDISAAERDLDYVPKVGLTEGIAAYAERLRAR